MILWSHVRGLVAVTACAGLGGGTGGPPHLPGGRSLWGRHPPSVCCSPRGRSCGPHLGDQRDYYAVASDYGPQCPGGYSDVGSARGGLELAPTPSLLFPPPVAYRDYCQLSPTALHDWLHEQASILVWVGYYACWGANYTPGGGFPLDEFNRDQQCHISAHCMDNIPTMTVLAHRSSSHRDMVLDTTCLCVWNTTGSGAPSFVCSTQSHEWRPAQERLAVWLDRYVGRRAAPVRAQLWEPVCLEQWVVAL